MYHRSAATLYRYIILTQIILYFDLLLLIWRNYQKLKLHLCKNNLFVLVPTLIYINIDNIVLQYFINKQL
jgi:hypothetical protein